MIISASRRTDIPAFYTTWFMNRIKAGFCSVPNPFNTNQVAHVSLKPEDVEVIVFWTRHPAPLLPHLIELDESGYRYYFQYTLLDYPRLIEPHSPSRRTAVRTFQELSSRIGAERMIWRYDPIVFSDQTPINFHLDTYESLIEELSGYTKRSVISIVDPYRSAEKRLRLLADQGLRVFSPPPPEDPSLSELIQSFVRSASRAGMEIFSCAETYPLEKYGVKPGKCIDDEYIHSIFSLSVSHQKDPSQRSCCKCVISKDIGMYDSCLFSCTYCYATTSFERARANHRRHNPESESML